MENQIREILSDVPGVDVQKVRHLYRITILNGKHVGARGNGVSLAKDMLARWQRGDYGPASIAHPQPSVSGEEMRGAPPEPHPEPEAPTVIENPETQERLAEALRKLSEAEAALESRKAGSDIPPPDIADLIRLNETYERANERLVALFNEAKQKAYLAMNRDGTYEGLSAVAWEKKAERYDSAIKWNRGRSAETI